MEHYGNNSLPDRFWKKVSPEPNTGCWLWDGATGSGGYGNFVLDGQTHKAHRLAYQRMVGPADELEIDHVCRNRACVNPSHLRSATKAQNQQYKKNADGSASGFKGVVWCKKKQRWRSRIAIDGRMKSLGRYSDPQDAARAYDAAAVAHFGDFALTNKELGLYGIA